MKVVKNLPKKILSVYLGEDYETGSYTLGEALGRSVKAVNEPLLAATCKLDPKRDKTKELSVHDLREFTAWTKNYVFFLVCGLFGDFYIGYCLRNPPKKVKK